MAAISEQPRPLILMYHSVAPYETDPYLVTVHPRRLREQLAWFDRRGLRGVSVRELLAARELGIGRGLVGLTFDDGYADFVEHALPVLLAYGHTATVYVVAGRLGGDNAWDPRGPRKPLMTAEAVRLVAAAGMEIGSHGLWHESLPQCGSGALADEVGKSKALLEEIGGGVVSSFCYPYGHVSAPAVEAVRAHGYESACAIWGSAWSGRYALTRTYIGDRDRAPHLFVKRLRHRLR